MSETTPTMFSGYNVQELMEELDVSIPDVTLSSQNLSGDPGSAMMLYGYSEDTYATSGYVNTFNSDIYPGDPYTNFGSVGLPLQFFSGNVLDAQSRNQFDESSKVLGLGSNEDEYPTYDEISVSDCKLFEGEEDEEGGRTLIFLAGNHNSSESGYIYFPDYFGGEEHLRLSSFAAIGDESMEEQTLSINITSLPNSSPDVYLRWVSYDSEDEREEGSILLNLGMNTIVVPEHNISRMIALRLAADPEEAGDGWETEIKFDLLVLNDIDIMSECFSD